MTASPSRLKLERVTCIEGADRLLNPLPEPYAAEIYGSWRLVNSIMHKSIACLSREGPVAVILVQEFGGLDPYLVGRHAKILGGDLSRVLLSRAFKPETIPHAIDSIPEGVRKAVVVDPFLFAPDSPRDYWRLTPIVSAFKRALGRGISIAVFNRETAFGRGFLPEGGKFHHHTLHAIARVSRCGARSLKLELVKHPHRPPAQTCIPSTEVGVHWDVQPRLLEWL
ncbi:MAG: hypothetical protein F7B20_05490 [Aeropyrum sp.]|nr:hypothetical protein [Aeropyrum sp.]